jgi:5-methylcytosine-specific restriction enzyme A
MNNTNLFAFKKIVDLSLLTDGITLTYAFREMIYQQLPDMKTRGAKRKIQVILDNTIYDISLNNVAFNVTKYPNHEDILQFRYSVKSNLALEFQRVFNKSYTYLLENYIKGKHIVLPANLKEYVVFYFTSQPDTFVAECILADDIREEYDAIKEYDEMQVEDIINYYATDPKSGYKNRVANTKIRDYNRNIGETLKLMYQHKCQICGAEFKGRYDIDISEIHHIEYYSKSLNNNSDNLLVLCPNHHRIIHKANPEFNRDGLYYRYANGLEDKLTINNHLRGL